MSSRNNWMNRPSGAKQVLSGLACLVVLCVIGYIDYRADYRLLFTVLYVLPIGFATLYVNRGYAIFLALLSVSLWTGGDILGGAPFPGWAIRLWNDGIVLSLLLIVVFLLDTLRKTLVDLEATVEARTQALRTEMEERRRLESETLNLSERERQAFGHEIHDVVCQDLASITIAANLLSKTLKAKGFSETEKASEIAFLIDQVLAKARSVARGYFTAGFDVTSLAEALRENARNVEARTGVKCEVKWQQSLVIANEGVVMHFYRIAQEAIQNAINHAEATRIEVSLERIKDSIRLAIEDNGKGLSVSAKPPRGLGLRIMAYRAATIGGEMNLETLAGGGTRVVCTIPVDKVSSETPLVSQ